MKYQGDIDSEIEFHNAKPFSIDMWYDRSEKSWTVWIKDEVGNQIGNTVYVHSKPEALNQVEYWKEKYGIPLIRTLK